MGDYNSKQAIIWDIDGTLSNPEHRSIYVNCEKKDRDFDKFRELAYLDTPKIVEIGICNGNHLNGFKVIFCTGRLESDREMTIKWLKDHGVAAAHAVVPLDLRMRPDERQFEKDYVVKSDILDEILNEGYTVHMVYDDRDQVVKMFRKRGLICHQVQNGNY